MNIIVSGAGEIGCHLAERLSRHGHRVCVIDSDPDIAAKLDQALDVKVVPGNGARANTQLEAKVEKCEMFLAVSGDTTTNLLASTLARKLGAARIMCRVDPLLEREAWLGKFRDTFGANQFFSPEHLAALELAKTVRNPGALAVEEIARGQIEVQQVMVASHAEAAGRPLHELKPPPRARVAMISREGENFVPAADTLLLPGDVATIFGTPASLRTLAGRLQGKLEKEPRVVISGGGEYGYSLASNLLESGCKVRILDRRLDRCRHLAGLLPKAVVIHADATVAAQLEEEQIGLADFFVAASGSDEDNVMSCLLARTLGAKTCLTLIHRADYANSIRSYGKNFGLAGAVSPREAVFREVARSLSTDPFFLVNRIIGAEVLELPVGDQSLAAGHKLAEIMWPPNCVLVGLCRKDECLVPGADDVLRAGDLVFAVTSPESRGTLIAMLS